MAKPKTIQEKQERIFPLTAQDIRNIVEFIIEAVKKGIPEDEIRETVDIMADKEIQRELKEAEKELREGRAKHFKTTEEAIAWLKSED